MKLSRICLISLGCVSTAVAFGVLAHAAIDLVLPAPQPVAVEVAKAEVAKAEVAKPVEAPPTTAPAPTVFELAAAATAPADITTHKVKTIPMLYREPIAVVEQARVPLPRPRPRTAPGIDSLSSISRQPASMAIAAAAKADNGDPLGAAGIERMKTALALTTEQQEYWPAIAAELRALGKAMHKSNGKSQKVSVDDEAIQRLYWAAAPLISRLSSEQKLKVKQLAHVMGLHQVAAAL